MIPLDDAANTAEPDPFLERLLGRALGLEEPLERPAAQRAFPRRPLFEGERPGARLRRLARRPLIRASAAVVVALAVGWALTWEWRPSPRPGPPPVPIAAGSTVAAGTSRSEPLLRSLRAASQCRTEPALPGRARCSIAGVVVDYEVVEPARLRAVYGDAVGSASRPAGSGPPACARGGEDERSWSMPTSPRRVAGRYACRLELGRAAMWWTLEDRGLLAHAVASDADLASLFAWWLAHGDV